MRSVFLIGFQGLGIRDARYKQERGLILLGHVGIAFEGNKRQIFGFHPTLEAIKAIGDQYAVIAWLRNRNSLDGCLQDDTAIFKRAYELSRTNKRITVWEYAIQLEDKAFATMQLSAQAWYNEKKIFPYGLPAKVSPQTWDNCAAFPRHLGQSLPEETGQLYWYIPVLEANGYHWEPEED